MEKQKKLSSKSVSSERSDELILVSARLIRLTSKQVYKHRSLQCLCKGFHTLLFTFRPLTFLKCILTALDDLIERLEPKVGVNDSNLGDVVTLL